MSIWGVFLGICMGAQCFHPARAPLGLQAKVMAPGLLLGNADPFWYPEEPWFQRSPPSYLLALPRIPNQ